MDGAFAAVAGTPEEVLHVGTSDAEDSDRLVAHELACESQDSLPAEVKHTTSKKSRNITGDVISQIIITGDIHRILQTANFAHRGAQTDHHQKDHEKKLKTFHRSRPV